MSRLREKGVILTVQKQYYRFLQLNLSKRIQIFGGTSACSEPYGEYSYVISSPESLLYHAQQKQDNSHKHDAVDGDGQVHQVRLILRLWLLCDE